jgi:hypothetical protein
MPDSTGCIIVKGRKSTIFRSAKRPVLSVLMPRLFTVRFAWGFPLTVLEPFANRSVADPWVCGDLSQTVPLPLQLQRHHATFFACFLTFAQCFLAAFAIAARPAADKTRFFTPFNSRFICRFVELPNASAADTNPFN